MTEKQELYYKKIGKKIVKKHNNLATFYNYKLHINKYSINTQKLFIFYIYLIFDEKQKIEHNKNLHTNLELFIQYLTQYTYIDLINKPLYYYFTKYYKFTNIN